MSVNQEKITIVEEVVQSEAIPMGTIGEVLSNRTLDEDQEIITPKGVVTTVKKLREESLAFDYSSSPLASKVKSKRVEAIEFLTRKDNIKFDFKVMLKDCLKGADDSVSIIRSIYKIKILNKSFKHLNANSKRIALNSYIADRLMEHTARTKEITTPILVMLKNDNNIIDYAVLLKRALVMSVNKKVKLY